MRTRFLLSLVPLGAALAGAAPAAQAQPNARILVCRDGAQIASRDARACDGHRGVDARATAYVRQQRLGGYPNGGYPNGSYSSGGYSNGSPNGGYRNHGQEVAAERRAERDARRDARGRADRRDDRHDDRRYDQRDERRHNR